MDQQIWSSVGPSSIQQALLDEVSVPAGKCAGLWGISTPEDVGARLQFVLGWAGPAWKGEEVQTGRGTASG